MEWSEARVCEVGWKERERCAGGVGVVLREKYAGCVGWGGGRADDLPLILHIEDQVIDVHCLSDQV